MSQKLAESIAMTMGRHTGRRGFLRRVAMVGSAVAVNPVEFAVRPVSAYAAICTCSGQGCVCGSACCDGYTEFCCSIIGQNRCPSGTALGGWWRADGSSFCNGPRYYLDCNVLPGSAGVCSCGCANDDCSLRKSCCTHFRYGQCHQEIAGMGAILCRVVTCTPPWELDATCTTTTAVDNATLLHEHAPCLHPIPAPTGPVPPWEDDMPPAPAVVIDSNGRRWVFVRGLDGQLWANVDGGWTGLGGVLTSSPSAVASAAGRIDVVARGADGATWVNHRLHGSWVGWESVGGQS